MKRVFFLVTVILLSVMTAFSQSKPYHVVFDLTSGDTSTHQRVIRWIKSILTTHPDAQIEVVFYGKALPMVETEKSSVTGDIKNLLATKNVKFAVCEQAMQVHEVSKSQLIPGVSTVPDAIYELVTKQAEGFGYIKVVN